MADTVDKMQQGTSEGPLDGGATPQASGARDDTPASPAPNTAGIEGTTAAQAHLAGNPSTESDSQANIDTGPAIAVSIENIESQLNELWRDVAETAHNRGGSGSNSVTMAQVLNLIVHAASQDAANEYVADTEKIAGRHPCRVLAVVEDAKGADTPVQAWVSMFCQIPPAGGRQVCCEQVMLVSGGESIRQIPAAVLPLLMSDLPVFLWWPNGSPFDDYVFRQLADSLDRLIIDSATFDSPEGALQRMASRLKSTWPHISGTDINWGRLTHWREVVASFFDAPDLRPYLDRVTSVTIEYAQSAQGKPVNRAQALMLAGWLASRLGWQPADNIYKLEHSPDQLPPLVHLSLRSGKRPIAVTIAPSQHKSDISGDICRVQLEVPGEAQQDGQPPADGAAGAAGAAGGQPDQEDGCEREACFEVAFHEDSDEAGSAWTSVQVDGAPTTTRNIQMEALTRSDLLDSELEVYSRDRVYEEAMDMVALFIRGGFAAPDTEGPGKITTGEPISAQSQASRTRPPGVPPR